MNKLLSALIIFCFTLFSYGKTNEEFRLWGNFNSSVGEEQIDALNNLLSYYERLSYIENVGDSITNRLLDYSLHSHDVELILKAYTFYFERVNALDATSLKRLREIALLAESTSSPRIKWHELHFEAILNFEKREFSKAIGFGSRALDIANELKDVELQLKSLLPIADYYNWHGERKPALLYFLQALDLAKKEKLHEYIIAAYGGIANMFYTTRNFEKSLEYRKKCIEVILKNPPIDSLQYIDQQYFVIDVQTNINFNEDLENAIEEQLEFAKKKGFELYYRRLWSLYRSNLINNLRFGKLYQLYNHTYPEELVLAKEESVELYLRLNGYFHEYQGNLDSAKYYWSESKRYVDKIENVYIKAHSYNRYAEFLIRMGDYDFAYKLALLGYKWSIASKYLEFQHQSLSLLEEIDIKRNKYFDAYNHAKIKNELKKEIDEKTEQEGLLVAEIQHEVERRSILQKKEEESQQAEMRASRLKANAFGAGLLLFLVLSGVIFRQYQLTRKEKDRSDELLLNILPEETARELINTGITTARQYADVTVLFCDIVGFTKVAELLTAQELVKEIDTYFRAFDDIIGEHGMEKIKTVGDAYVAVGGMPLHNEASAKDVVNAAIAMLKKVQDLGLQRKAENRPAFELRVGLHTGSVVAGVVGSKKFQFDIWGDAVNVAARMEQNSEPGKINVSDVTYETIKNDFTCVARGKIEAKNKGLIEMFFVEFNA